MAIILSVIFGYLAFGWIIPGFPRKVWRITLFRVLLALDQLGNVLPIPYIGFGFPDESWSGRAGRALATGRQHFWVKSFCKTLDYVFEKLVGEKEHCKNSIEPDERFNERFELFPWYKLTDEEKELKRKAER